MEKLVSLCVINWKCKCVKFCDCVNNNIKWDEIFLWMFMYEGGKLWLWLYCYMVLYVCLVSNLG